MFAINKLIGRLDVDQRLREFAPWAHVARRIDEELFSYRHDGQYRGERSEALRSSKSNSSREGGSLSQYVTLRFPIIF